MPFVLSRMLGCLCRPVGLLGAGYCLRVHTVTSCFPALNSQSEAMLHRLTKLLAEQPAPLSKADQGGKSDVNIEQQQCR